MNPADENIKCNQTIGQKAIYNFRNSDTIMKIASHSLRSVLASGQQSTLIRPPRNDPGRVVIDNLQQAAKEFMHAQKTTISIR